MPGPSFWAVNDGEKVLRDSLNHPAKSRNSAWDGSRVTLFACRNETVAFQLVVEAPGEDVKVKSLSLTFGDQSLSSGVEIFSEHYLHVAKPTPPYDERANLWGWFWCAAAAPKLAPGWIPDALVPLNARAGRGGLPLTIPKGTLQAFWFDASVPRLGVPAGRHEGVVALSTSAGDAKIPVLLEVMDATLPDKNAVKIMVYISDIGRRHGGSSPGLFHDYRCMAHRHRFDAVEYVDFMKMDSYLPYLTGEAYTPARGYTGPGEGIGHAVFGVDFYGAEERMKAGRDAFWKYSDRWMEWFRKNAPSVLPFLYLADEPRADMVPWVKKHAGWVHANPGPGRKLPVFVTTQPKPALEGAVDIWATVADQVKTGAIKSRRQKGQRWWFYNGMRPMSGAVPLDANAVDFRVQPWICRMFGVELWFYWEGTHWQHNHSGPRANKDQDVWEDPVTFSGGPDLEINGDGTLFYPGQDVKFPDQDRGIAGPISSIRMKNLRRGQQDVAYMELASRAGRRKEAQAIAKKLIPRAFDLAGADEQVSWPLDGSAWDEARRAIARLFSEDPPR